MASCVHQVNCMYADRNFTNKKTMVYVRKQGDARTLERRLGI